MTEVDNVPAYCGHYRQVVFNTDFTIRTSIHDCGMVTHVRMQSEQKEWEETVTAFCTESETRKQ